MCCSAFRHRGHAVEMKSLIFFATCKRNFQGALAAENIIPADFRAGRLAAFPVVIDLGTVDLAVFKIYRSHGSRSG